MKKNGLLNSNLSALLSDMRHIDQFTIGDAGLPVPEDVWQIDLALSENFPSFIAVLENILEDFEVEKIILAEEIKENNATQLENIKELLPDDIEIEFVSHEDFKVQTAHSKAIVRTGEMTAFSNIILQSGVIF